MGIVPYPTFWDLNRAPPKKGMYYRGAISSLIYKIQIRYSIIYIILLIY